MKSLPDGGTVLRLLLKKSPEAPPPAALGRVGVEMGATFSEVNPSILASGIA
jgi:hypothetical protein